MLLVDEICDSGRTLASLKLLISQRNAASVKTCVLLDKVSRRQADIRPDYVGAVCPDEFVVGYGMDWGGKLRSLPFVGVVRRELYASPTRSFRFFSRRRRGLPRRRMTKVRSGDPPKPPCTACIVTLIGRCWTCADARGQGCADARAADARRHRPRPRRPRGRAPPGAAGTGR